MQVDDMMGQSEGPENFDTDQIVEEGVRMEINEGNHQGRGAGGDQTRNEGEYCVRPGNETLPLSRHYPKEVLSSHSSGASKNLLI